MPAKTQNYIVTGAGLTGGPITSAGGTISETQLINAQVGTSYTILSTDNCKLITFNNASPVAVTLPISSTSGFGTGFNFAVWNYGAGTVTITPTTSRINNGGPSLNVPQNTGSLIVCDGTNYQVANCSALNPSLTPTALCGYIAGLTLSNDGTTPNTIIDIAAGTCCDSTVARMISIAAFTKTTATWVSGTGHGGLDTGAIAASTWYHVYIISDPTGTIVDALLSLSATAPTMPSGYTLFRRIGSIKTDGSSHILTFVQDGSTFYWGTQILDVSSASLSSGTRTLYTLSVPSGLKVLPIGRLACTTNTPLMISSLDETAIAPTTSGVPGADIAGNSTNKPSIPIDASYYTNTSSQLGVYCGSGTATFSIVTRGWIDDRGVFG